MNDLRDEMIKLGMDQYDQGRIDTFKSLSQTLEIIIEAIGNVNMPISEFNAIIKEQLQKLEK